MGQAKTLGDSRGPVCGFAPRVHAAAHMGHRAEPKECKVERELVSGPFELRQRLAGEAFEPVGRTLWIDESGEPGSLDRRDLLGGSSSDGRRPGAELACGLVGRSEEHTSELQSLRHLVCRLLLE